MADREKILRYFKAGGDEQLAAKLLDLAEGANKSRKFRVSEFLDPHAYNVAEIIAANYENVRLESDGGFSNAERVKAAFVADDFYGQPDFGMAYFLAAWDKRYYDLSHRDILGAFMGTGCKREALGDIVFSLSMYFGLPMIRLPLPFAAPSLPNRKSLEHSMITKLCLSPGISLLDLPNTSKGKLTATVSGASQTVSNPAMNPSTGSIRS